MESLSREKVIFHWRARIALDNIDYSMIILIKKDLGETFANIISSSKY
jgi:hypothetical protein